MATLNRKSIIALAAIWGAWLCLSPATFAVDYDLVINGGRVMDPETMYDAIANVGVKDGRIVAITKRQI